MYNTLQQSLPPAPQLDAFLSSNQTAISQLAERLLQHGGEHPGGRVTSPVPRAWI